MDITEMYICSTYYHVYISVIKVLVHKKRADIIICDDIPDYKTLITSLSKANCFHNVYFFDRSSVTESFGRSKIDWLLFQHKRNKSQIEKAFKIDLKRYKNINIFHDDIVLGRYLQDINKKYVLLEDSLNFFKIISQTKFAELLPNYTLKYHIKRALNIGYFPLGQSKYAVSIEVNDKNGIAIPLKKVLEHPKNKLLKKLTTSDKQKIYEIFMNEYDENLNVGSNTVLVLTQPLFSDGYVATEDEQLNVYNSIIASYKVSGKNIALKPHPRDFVNYNTMLTKACIINKNIPVEILNFSPQVYFDVAVTIFSTAIFNIEFVKEKVVLGIEYLSKFTR